MQTFLPFADFSMSAAVLDDRRLAKQLIENKQIMIALMTGRGFVGDPATLMWRKYEWALCQYHEALFRELYYQRGSNSRVVAYDELFDIYEKHKTWTEQRVWPYWLGQPEIHDSHKSTLLREDPEHYGQYFHGYDPTVEIKYPLPENEYRRLLRVLWMPRDQF